MIEAAIRLAIERLDFRRTIRGDHDGMLVFTGEKPRARSQILTTRTVRQAGWITKSALFLHLVEHRQRSQEYSRRKSLELVKCKRTLKRRTE